MSTRTELTATMSEKLCLQWNDFRDIVNCAFRSLRKDVEFGDVTLACEDGKLLETHKVILAASSPFFQNLLRRNKHPRPLIYMRGIKSADLLAIVDFLYCGEANVLQENLDSFLAIAEELQLKGFSGQGSGNVNVDTNLPKSLAKRIEPVFKKELKTPISTGFDTSKPDDQLHENEFDQAHRRVTLTSLFSEELNEKVEAMLEKTQNVVGNGKKVLYVCKVCGKGGEHKMNMKRHIEAIHLEGVTIPCNLCEKHLGQDLL